MATKEQLVHALGAMVNATSTKGRNAAINRLAELLLGDLAEPIDGLSHEESPPRTRMRCAACRNGTAIEPAAICTICGQPGKWI